ncbi:MAG TPA: hypothetical protein VKH81_16585 [Candidatus Angelobacter sp.]|nr:hypothetical protein [Candidatus Angelobacter sp.]
MSYSELLQGLGFRLDPFAKTNADEEELLKSYFIEPPFFKAVYGDLSTPKSAVVFAPRGGGKTALKRMLEVASLSDGFMCVTYNQFPVAGYKLDKIDLEYHLRNIARLLLVAVISTTAEKGVEHFTSDSRHLLFLMTKEYLSDIDTTELKAAISSVQKLIRQSKGMVEQIHWPYRSCDQRIISEDRIGERRTRQIFRCAWQTGAETGSNPDSWRIRNRLGIQVCVCSDR